MAPATEGGSVGDPLWASPLAQPKTFVTLLSPLFPNILWPCLRTISPWPMERGPPQSSGRGHRPICREGGPPSPSGEQWDHQAEPVFSPDSVGLPTSVSACLPHPSHPTRPSCSLSTLLLGALLSPSSHQRLSPNPYLPISPVLSPPLPLYLCPTLPPTVNPSLSPRSTSVPPTVSPSLFPWFFLCPSLLPP